MFAKENVTVIEVELISITCVSSTYALVFVRVTFKLGIKAGFVIETHLKEEIKNKSLGDLPVNNTHSNVTFEGKSVNSLSSLKECFLLLSFYVSLSRHTIFSHVIKTLTSRVSREGEKVIMRSMGKN